MLNIWMELIAVAIDRKLFIKMVVKVKLRKHRWEVRFTSKNWHSLKNEKQLNTAANTDFYEIADWL